MDSRFAWRSQIGCRFRTLLENPKPLKNSLGSLHKCFAFTKLEFLFRRQLANLSHEFRQTRRFEGVRFFPNSPTRNRGAAGRGRMGCDWICLCLLKTV
jgi:hypothetical protein